MLFTHFGVSGPLVLSASANMQSFPPETYKLKINLKPALTEEELDGFAANIPKGCKTVYLGHEVLPSESQEKLFKQRGITKHIIPHYYYGDLEV